MLYIDQFRISEIWDVKEIYRIIPFGNGHINDTYLVESADQKYILQKVNIKVFRTKELVSNYSILIDNVKKFQADSGKKITPNIFKNKSGNYHFVDQNDSAWRLVEFISNAASYDVSPNVEISYHAAKAIGNYQLFLNTIDPDLIRDTVIEFHNLPKRKQVFDDVLKSADEVLVSKAKKEIEQVLGMGFIVEETKMSMKDLPLRINHNDTKLNNVLFVGEEVLVIDLDTVMRGNVMFDFGDMVRTFTSPALEDEKELEKTDFRIAHFSSLTKGYLEPLKNSLSDIEKESLFMGAMYIIYEQALRFLTDYLNGSIYYKVAYPEHNLVRCRTQLRLLQHILHNRHTLVQIIEQNG